MKKFFVSALVVCAMSMSVAVNAQECKTECAKPEKKECVMDKGEKMAKELKLTEDQKLRIKGINEEFEAAKKLSREDMKQAREKRQAAMNEVLTPEQQAKMKEMRQMHKKEMRHGQPMMRKGHHRHVKCDSVNGECTKHHACKEAKGECGKMKDCTKKGENCTTKCDKAKGCDKQAECGKMKDCTKKGDCKKGDCKATEGCAKKGECKKNDTCPKVEK